jgi:hypothetical protein
LATAAIRSAVAGTEPVEPAMMIGPVTLPWQSAVCFGAQDGVAVPGRRGFAEFGQPRRPEGAGDLQEFRVSCHHKRMIGGIELVERAQSRSSVSIESISSARLRASQMASAGLAGRHERRIRMNVAHDLRQLVAPGKDQARKLQQPGGVGSGGARSRSPASASSK